MRHAKLPPLRRALAAAAISVLFASSAGATGDVAKGQKAFAKCKICHEASSAQNKIGPSLKGIFGRKAGTAAGYTYSSAMTSSGIVWNEDKLKAFVANPKALVSGTKMTFVGLKKQDEIEDLIAYLKTATK